MQAFWKPEGNSAKTAQKIKLRSSKFSKIDVPCLLCD